MGIVEKTHATAPSTLADVDRFRLRRFVEGLGDELETVSEPTDLADVAAILEGNPKAVLFRAVGPERQALVAGRAIARAFGVKPNELLPELLRRLRSKPDVFDVSRAEAPVQEVVRTGDDADLTTLPVHLGHGADGAPYISSSIDFVVDPDATGMAQDGTQHVPVRRVAELLEPVDQVHRGSDQLLPERRAGRRPHRRPLRAGTRRRRGGDRCHP